jgi:hypothetical protein
LRSVAERRLVTGDKKAKEKARSMTRLIKNDNFWKALIR